MDLRFSSKLLRTQAIPRRFPFRRRFPCPSLQDSQLVGPKLTNPGNRGDGKRAGKCLGVVMVVTGVETGVETSVTRRDTYREFLWIPIVIFSPLGFV